MNDDFLMAGTPATEDDKRLFVVFSHEARIDQRASEEAGRNIYKNVEFVTIRIPGDKTLSIHRPVMPSDKMRFPMQYQAFKNRNDEIVVGTPLSTWPGITPAQCKDLEFFNVRTVEQLATMPDSGAGQMMGIQRLKQSAQKFIAAGKERAPAIALQKERDEREAEVKALHQKIDEQAALVAKLLAAIPEEQPKKKGK